METVNKIKGNINIVEVVENIFKLKKDKINFISNNYFMCNFTYNKYEIRVYTTKDLKYNEYFDIDYKRNDDSEYHYVLTSFWVPLAYNDKILFNHCYNKNDAELYLMKLREYIDNNSLIFEFYKKDLSRRFFNINNVQKELPIIVSNDDYENKYDEKKELMIAFKEGIYERNTNVI